MAAGPGAMGAAFRCALESTWGAPDAAVEEDPACGRVDVRC
jgi:hypothetical protein